MLVVATAEGAGSGIGEERGVDARELQSSPESMTSIAWEELLLRFFSTCVEVKAAAAAAAPVAARVGTLVSLFEIAAEERLRLMDGAAEAEGAVTAVDESTGGGTIARFGGSGRALVGVFTTVAVGELDGTDERVGQGANLGIAAD
jgi:hypothetical protein